jgi:hypothetical protein
MFIDPFFLLQIYSKDQDMYANLCMYLKIKYQVHEQSKFSLQSKEDIQLGMNNFSKRI